MNYMKKLCCWSDCYMSSSVSCKSEMASVRRPERICLFSGVRVVIISLRFFLLV